MKKETFCIVFLHFEEKNRKMVSKKNKITTVKRK